LELFWAIGSLIGCEVPFPEAECRVFCNELLQYIGTENDKFIMHALICCLSVTLSKLHASPAAGASAVDLAAVRLQQQIDKQQAIRALINLLSQVNFHDHAFWSHPHLFHYSTHATLEAAECSSLLIILAMHKVNASSVAA
jgi:hypothetical protein